MTIELTPFADDKSIVITDTHGNELNIQNDVEQLVIYGKWQGKKDAPEFLEFVAMMNKVQSIFESENLKANKEQEGFKLSKKKDEVLLDVDVTLEKDIDSSEKVFKFVNKSLKMK